MKGAGGSPGGVGQFFLGAGMLVGGGYLLLSSIVVRSAFSLSTRLYSFGGGVGVTSGMVLIPFLIGIVLVFRDGGSRLGWLLSVGSVVALVFGVLSSIHFRMRSMSAFDLLTVLVLTFGGLGLLLRSLRSTQQQSVPAQRD